METSLQPAANKILRKRSYSEFSRHATCKSSPEAKPKLDKTEKQEESKAELSKEKVLTIEDLLASEEDKPGDKQRRNAKSNEVCETYEIKKPKSEVKQAEGPRECAGQGEPAVQGPIMAIDILKI